MKQFIRTDSCRVMNLGEFRRLTANMTDDTELVFWDDGYVTWYEIADRCQFLPATSQHPTPVYVLEFGQEVEMEFDLAVRTGIDDGYCAEV